jgi:hypothetical protein
VRGDGLRGDVVNGLRKRFADFAGLVRTDARHKSMLSGFFLPVQNLNDQRSRLSFTIDHFRKAATRDSIQVHVGTHIATFNRIRRSRKKSQQQVRS